MAELNGIPLPARFAETVADWQRRLLQLDRRNNLLYFKPGKRAVRVLGRALEDILEPLQCRQGLTFDYAEHRSRRAQPLVETEPDPTEQPDVYIDRGDLRGDCSPLELQRRLGRLRRRDREWEAEQGLNVLFLAIGFLEWIDQDGQDARSPLLLFPCDLDRPSPRDHFTLLQDDDEDLSSNATLAVKLRDFGIELPEHDSGEESPGRYLEKVRALIDRRPDWHVTDDMYLATFAYSKLAMWRDLETIKNHGTNHPIVLALAGGTPRQGPDPTPSGIVSSLPAELAGAQLDDTLGVRDQYCVLPADFSQLVAIKKIIEGSNLVIDGPPGTGKSQTIANLIGTLLAHGKTVLFVSEKTAALDVVKRWLDKMNLGTFCLDLHSERGSKANVYQQLKDSVEDPRAVPRGDYGYEALSDRRQRLNAFVRTLHKTWEPLGYSVFEVHGRFATLREAPDVAFDVEGIPTLTQQRIAVIVEAADRLRLRTREFREHSTSHWRVLTAESPSLEMANGIRRDMNILVTVASSLQAAINGLANALSLNSPRNVDQVIRFEIMARHLGSAPGVPKAWLQNADTASLRDIALKEASRQSRRTALLIELTLVFDGSFLDLDFATAGERLTVTPAEQQLLTSLLGGNWEQQVLAGMGSVSKSFIRLESALAHATSVAAVVQQELKLPADTHWTSSSMSLAIAETLARGPVHPTWIEPGGTRLVRKALEESRQIASTLTDLENNLFADFERELIEVATLEVLTRYRTAHQSPVRRIMGSSYRSDRNVLRALYRKSDKLRFAQETKAVEDAFEVRRQRGDWEEASERLACILHRGFAGRETDWSSLFSQLDQVENLLETWPGNRVDCACFLNDKDCASTCSKIARDLDKALAHARTLIDTCLYAGAAGEIYAGMSELPSLEESVRRAAAVAQRIETAATPFLTHARQPFSDLEPLRNLVLLGAELKDLEQGLAETSEALRSSFGELFRHFETDWSAVLECISWTEKLFAILPASELPSNLLDPIVQPRLLPDCKALADSAANLVSQFLSDISSLRERYDLASVQSASWESTHFDQLSDWAIELSRDADAATDWLSYKAAVAELHRLLNCQATECIRQQTDDSRLVPAIVERRILNLWLDWAYRQEPTLAEFASADHEDLIAKFKDLDKKLPAAAQVQVRRKVLQNYPSLGPTAARTSEVGILLRELAKHRRRWPVRKLLTNAPSLIQKFKPCFLVSPLAVSQFLPLPDGTTGAVQFDAVIFDEASQVFPEDAIPAILRGKQLVLAGDPQQLPPSSFWMQSLTDDGHDYDDDTDEDPPNMLLGQESILDAGIGRVGQIFDQAHLNVHYRSKNETLIRFSNHHFYNDRLIVFPSPGLRNLWQGVHNVYVSDGRYDAGGTRTNQREAERVVEIVFEHMRTRPLEDSLGVVALSRAQADLIERLIEERRILERDVDQRFGEKTDEPFFVKNLENVQGDQRDRIVISIGYGPTVGSGAVPNRFGPLNNSGGGRRLNVVITRARQRVDLVHSLKPADISSQQPGARLLRRYLEYVANPRQAFEGEIIVDPDAEPDSPFEAAVERALIARGFRVARQVGVSGYRIDLAILSEDGSRYDLGIECDGWTYHSAPAARDRDWLRQQVLEGLGWSIHRVWSTAWVRNPEAEIARIEASLGRARSEATYGRSRTVERTEAPNEPEPLGEPDIPDDGNPVEELPHNSAEIQLQEYERVNLHTPPSWAELKYELLDNLVQLIRQTAQVEGPVHIDVVIDRIRLCYGLGRVRMSTRQRVVEAVHSAIHGGWVKHNKDFIFTSDAQLRRHPRQPTDGRIEHVPPWELGIVLISVARTNFGAPRSDLIIETARKFGFNRTGTTISEVLDSIVEGLLKQGLLVESLGMIRAVG